VAEYAGIPTSSCYHFYPEIKELYKDLVRLIAQEMIEDPIKISSPPNWEYVVAASVRAACDFYNRDYAATQLMLGSKTAPEIKREGCSQEIGFGDGLMNQISTYFILPYLANPKAIFFRAIQVADAMFQISIDEHDRLTEEYIEEATNVMVAYLALYLPRILPRQAKPIKSVGGAARKA
jgi:AcrR family transcriptional regulator